MIAQSPLKMPTNTWREKLLNVDSSEKNLAVTTHATEKLSQLETKCYERVFLQKYWLSPPMPDGMAQDPTAIPDPKPLPRTQNKPSRCKRLATTSKHAAAPLPPTRPRRAHDRVQTRSSNLWAHAPALSSTRPTLPRPNRNRN